jgi:hypothetical protein
MRKPPMHPSLSSVDNIDEVAAPVNELGVHIGHSGQSS